MLQVGASKKLGGVQRLVCLYAIALRSTPSAAMESNFRLAIATVQEIAKSTAYRLTHNQTSINKSQSAD